MNLKGKIINLGDRYDTPVYLDPLAPYKVEDLPAVEDSPTAPVIGELGQGKAALMRKCYVSDEARVLVEKTANDARGKRPDIQR